MAFNALPMALMALIIIAMKDLMDLMALMALMALVALVALMVLAMDLSLFPCNKLSTAHIGALWAQFQSIFFSLARFG